MKEFDFDTAIHTVQEFVEFCERVESTEAVPEKMDRKNNKRERSKRGFDQNAKTETTEKKKTENYCMLHGPNKSHTTENCRVLKTQAKRMKSTYDAQKDGQGKREFRKKQELHAIIETAIEAHESKKAKERSRKRVERDLSSFGELTLNEDAISIGSDDSN